MKDEYEEIQDVAVLQINDWQGFIENKQIKEIRFCYSLGQEGAFAITKGNIPFQIKMEQAIHIFDEENKRYRTGSIGEYQDDNGCRIEVVKLKPNGETKWMK